MLIFLEINFSNFIIIHVKILYYILLFDAHQYLHFLYTLCSEEINLEQYYFDSDVTQWRLFQRVAVRDVVVVQENWSMALGAFLSL